KKYQNQINCINSSGDYIQNCKNSIECYDCFDLEDCKYVIGSVNIKDCMDISLHDKEVELCYELSSGGDRNMNLKFSFCSCTNQDSDYLYSCFNLSNCFGCDSINKRNSHCILNKKYSEEEYKVLRQKIMEHMWQTKEYGEFFPIELSLYPYNETLAQDFFPLTGETAMEKGYKWRSKNTKNYQPSNYEIPSNASEVSDDILNEILVCKECGKNYKVIKQELNLYKHIDLPPSSLCSDCRYLELLSWKNPRKLHNRKCNKCGIDMESTYAPNRPEKVYCEECYFKHVY
ncbi:hypothetical protein KKF86_05120, partial [bacterium]|nr:hypothetical protein [bacterium]